MTISKGFLLVAVICFVLAVFGLVTRVPLVPLGLAFFAAAGLV